MKRERKCPLLDRDTPSSPPSCLGMLHYISVPWLMARLALFQALAVSKTGIYGNED